MRNSLAAYLDKNIALYVKFALRVAQTSLTPVATGVREFEGEGGLCGHVIGHLRDSFADSIHRRHAKKLQ